MVSMASYSKYNNNVLRYGLNPPTMSWYHCSKQLAVTVPLDETSAFYPQPRDALLVATINSFTSILAGFVIFSAIGFMAYTHNLPVDNIATDGE